MTAHIPLPGSARALLPNSRPAGPVDSSEITSLTIRLRSMGDVDELEKSVQKQSRQPLSSRRYLKREDFAKKHGASAADLDLIEDLAHEHNLTVVHRCSAERSIILRGRLGDLLNAFPADVRLYHHASGAYRGRQGEIRIPDKLAGIVTGVFGFDTRPKHRATLRRALAAAGPGGDNGVAATVFASRYHFPAAFKKKTLNGAGQTIGIIELGGGFRQTDIAAYFKALGLDIAISTRRPPEPSR